MRPRATGTGGPACLHGPHLLVARERHTPSGHQLVSETDQKPAAGIMPVPLTTEIASGRRFAMKAT